MMCTIRGKLQLIHLFIKIFSDNWASILEAFDHCMAGPEISVNHKTPTKFVLANNNKKDKFEKRKKKKIALTTMERTSSF